MPGVHKVVVATDSARIAELISTSGGEVVYTAPECPSGSDRVYRAYEQLHHAGERYDLVVNLQGDEPLMPPALIAGTIEALAETPQAQIATPAIPLAGGQLNNPDKVKVVANSAGRALYFSRAGLAASALHLGLYVYRPDALAEFCALAPSPLEQAERLEQLRALAAGMHIQLHQADYSGDVFGIDTPADLQRATQLLTNNPT